MSLIRNSSVGDILLSATQMITVHKKSKEQFLRELKSITKRSNGKG